MESGVEVARLDKARSITCRLTGIGIPCVYNGAMKSLILLSLGLAAMTTSGLAGERKVSPAKVVVFTNLFN